MTTAQKHDAMTRLSALLKRDRSEDQQQFDLADLTRIIDFAFTADVDVDDYETHHDMLERKLKRYNIADIVDSAGRLGSTYDNPDVISCNTLSFMRRVLSDLRQEDIRKTQDHR